MKENGKSKGGLIVAAGAAALGAAALRWAIGHIATGQGMTEDQPYEDGFPAAPPAMEDADESANQGPEEAPVEEEPVEEPTEEEPVEEEPAEEPEPDARALVIERPEPEPAEEPEEDEVPEEEAAVEETEEAEAELEEEPAAKAVEAPAFGTVTRFEGLPDHTLLVDYFYRVVGTPEETPYQELCLYTYGEADDPLLLEVYAGGGTENETMTEYLVPRSALIEAMASIEQYEMASWNDRDDCYPAAGAMEVVKFLNGSEYVRVTSEHMPEDGKVAFDAVGLVLGSYAREENLK